MALDYNKPVLFVFVCYLNIFIILISKLNFISDFLNFFLQISD